MAFDRRRNGRRVRLCTVALAVLVLAQHGCATIQKPSWNKPIGKGTWIPALVCGAIGAGVGIAIQSQRPGTSRVVVNGVERSVSDSQDLWKGAVIGAPIGAAVCGLLGHVFLDPTPAVAPAPPPPTPVPTPEPQPPPVVKRRIVLRGVQFDFDSSEIRSDAKPVLDRAVDMLGENGEVSVVVDGYTDSVGTDEYNLALSIRRAEAVYRYLVNRGIAPERLRVQGFGEARPVASNDTDSGRAQNRRVELRVMP